MPTNTHGADDFEQIAEERRRLAEILAGLSAEQWQQRSLCSAWTVRDVAAHLVAPLVVPIWRFGVTMLRAGGDFDQANRRTAHRIVETHGNRLPETLTAHADSRFTPPGQGSMAPLTDLVVHGHDIRRPLGLSYAVGEEQQMAVLDFLTTTADGASPFPAPSGSYRWQASDLDWSYGEGPIVNGPAASLMLLLTGRNIALSDVSGPGAERLASMHSSRTAR